MDIVLNTSVLGNTVRDLTSGFDWRVRQFNPGVVLLMININGCSDKRDITLEGFNADLFSLVKMLKYLGMKTFLFRELDIFEPDSANCRLFLP